MKIFVELWKKDKKKASSIVLTVVFVLFIVIGATYAFFMADTGDGATAGVRVVTKMSDSLMFEVGEDIFIDVNEQTLALNGTNISDSTYARATLRGNGDVKAQATYNVYLQIDTNSLEYTSNDQKPELLLQVTDPTGRAFGQSDLPNLAYVTAGTEANQVSGFDITTTSGLIKLANNYLIEVLNGQKMDEWTITMTFMNLDTDQFANTNKVLDARILIQKEEYTNPDIYIATTYDGSPIVPSTFGATAEIDCFGNDASYNYRYNRLIIGAINQESAACNLKFTTPSYKDYLNQKVIGLAGGGQVFNEDGYRYEGTNPDNYIWFNNELWRIIGVFGSGMHGEDANLVKIIRARSLG